MVKMMSIINDIRSVWIVLGFLVTAVVFAGDTRWITYSKHDAIVVKDIRRSILMLEIDKSYALTVKEKERYSRKIKLAENQIKEIKGE